jgi:aerobic C4-dicarboxylate transport protein
MSEARALTNFAGNAVATVLVGHWVGQLDREQVKQVFAGEDPFDEAAFAAGDTHAGDVPAAVTAGSGPETQDRTH